MQDLSTGGAVREPRVVVAHDYATQRGGAERVALAILRAFPGARLITSVYSPVDTYADFEDFEVETLWLQKVPLLRADPRRALPFLARAFSRFDVTGADVVVCSSSGWAHGIGGDAAKVVYCHNPARWLYQVDDYLLGRPLAGRVFDRAAGGLGRWDQESATRASLYFANSTTVRARIAAAYGIDAEFLPPPPGLDADGPQEPVPGVEPGFLLCVSRARAYKNTALVCDAVLALPGTRLVVVGGLPEPHRDGERLRGLTGISDAQLRWLYAHSAGLVAVGREDFGLTPVESYTFGRPAAVLRAGGYLDSAAEGIATVFIEEPSLRSVVTGIQALLARDWDEDAIRRHAERFSLSAFQARLVAAARSVWLEPRRTRTVSDPGQLNRERAPWVDRP